MILKSTYVTFPPRVSWNIVQKCRKIFSLSRSYKFPNGKLKQEENSKFQKQLSPRHIPIGGACSRGVATSHIAPQMSTARQLSVRVGTVECFRVDLTVACDVAVSPRIRR